MLLSEEKFGAPGNENAAPDPPLPPKSEPPKPPPNALGVAFFEPFSPPNRRNRMRVSSPSVSFALDSAALSAAACACSRRFFSSGSSAGPSTLVLIPTSGLFVNKGCALLHEMPVKRLRSERT